MTSPSRWPEVTLFPWHLLIGPRREQDVLFVATADQDVRALADAFAVDVDAGDDPGGQAARGHDAAAAGAAFGLVAAVAPTTLARDLQPRWEGLSLEQLAERVDPDGMLFLAVDRPAILVRPGRLRAALDRCGFDEVDLYWADPDALRARRVMPVGDPRIVRSYLATMLWRHSRVRRLLSGVLAAATRFGRFSSLMPAYVLIARRGPALSGADTLATLFAEGDLSVLGSTLPAPRWPAGPAWIMLRSGISHAGKVVVPWWNGATVEPDLVLKVQSLARGGAALEIEEARLRELQALRVGPPIGVPSPRASVIARGHAISVDTYVSGHSLAKHLAERRGEVAPTLEACRDLPVWLADLHSSPAGDRPAGSSIRALADRLRGAASTLSLTREQSGSLAAVATRAEELAASKPLPSTFNHNDMTPSNVLVDQFGRICGLADWESADWGAPATDLIYFLVMAVARDATAAALIAARDEVLPHGPHGGSDGRSRAALIGRGWLEGYRTSLGLAPEWLPILEIATWAMHAGNEAARGGTSVPAPFLALLARALDDGRDQVDGSRSAALASCA